MDGPADWRHKRAPARPSSPRLRQSLSALSPACWSLIRSNGLSCMPKSTTRRVRSPFTALQGSGAFWPPAFSGVSGSRGGRTVARPARRRSHLVGFCAPADLRGELGYQPLLAVSVSRSMASDRDGSARVGRQRVPGTGEPSGRLYPTLKPVSWGRRSVFVVCRFRALS